MRLQKLRIKNFRSIIDTEDFVFFDNKITTLVGGNGSGKSNILKGLFYIKGDEKVPSDLDFNVKAKGNIEILTDFMFDTNDEDILNKFNLKINEIKGFHIFVEKEMYKDATISYSPIGWNDKNQPLIQGAVKQIKTLLNACKYPDGSNFKISFFNIVDNVKDLKLNITKLRELLETQRTTIETVIIEDIFSKLGEIEELITFDINKIIEDIFSNNINIELLSLTNYEIKDRADIVELNDNLKQPFLFDLLELSGKKANEFATKTGRALDHTEEEASNNLSEAINKVWPSHNLKFKIDKNDNGLDFFVFTSLGKTVGLSDLSDGEQWFLKFYTKLAVSQKNSQQILWLFDEPGRDLHASSQSDLKKFFENISEKFQIIYTTHQPMMVPWNKLERLFVTENINDRGTIIHKRFWKDSKLGSPLKEALSSFVGEELFSNKEHIIIEGISDYFFLQGWLRYFQLNKKDKFWYENFNDISRSMVPVDGIEKVPLYCLFLTRETKKEINWVAVVDSSQEQDDLVKNKFPNLGLAGLTKKIVSIPEASSKKDSKEIEGLFTVDEYMLLMEKFYSKNWPQIKLPSIEEVKLDTGIENFTKKIEKIIKQKNIDYQINGKPFTLDKTGIAQEFYIDLLGKGEISYSVTTITNFEKSLKYIDKKFNEN